MEMTWEQAGDMIRDLLDERLLQMVLSGPRSREVCGVLKIRPVMLKGAVCFQTSFREGSREKHQNASAEETLAMAVRCLKEQYRQLQAECTDRTAALLVSKKGRITARCKDRKIPSEGPELSHDRTRNYLFSEGTPVPFLVKLGVMTPEGRVRAKYHDKFRQINRFLEFIRDVENDLPRGRTIRIVDFGCGKSYLTFAVYEYLHERRGLDVEITGLDLKEDVIQGCSALAEECGYSRLHFQTGDIARYESEEAADMVITLHACDTATDYALAKAVGWGARVILSVPCCQHELNGQIKSELLSPVLHYGIIRERMAALLTDGIRAQLLEKAGYRVQILEFIEMEHTPKNLLIRAVLRRSQIQAARRKEREPALPAGEAEDALARLQREIHAELTLERLLDGQAKPALTEETM